MSSTNEPSFDWSQAASLLGDDPSLVADDMAEIVAELIDSGYAHLQELKEKNPSTDRKTIAAQAHQLRGSLLNFGFTEVGGILLKIVKGDFADADYPALIDQTEKVFAASKKLLAGRYPTLKLS